MAALAGARRPGKIPHAPGAADAAGRHPGIDGAPAPRGVDPAVALAIVVAPILLHNSVYLADLNGRDSAEWSTASTTIVLGGLAAVLTLWWAMLSGLESRTSTPTVMWVLALDALAAAATVMLSGYYRAGLLGLGLAAALAGATLASYLARPRSTSSGSLGMGVIGIFSVVIIGVFFGSLTSGQMACLLLAPR